MLKQPLQALEQSHCKVVRFDRLPKDESVPAGFQRPVPAQLKAVAFIKLLVFIIGFACLSFVKARKMVLLIFGQGVGIIVLEEFERLRAERYAANAQSVEERLDVILFPFQSRSASACTFQLPGALMNA